jgi:hypothetical protein
MGTGAAKFVQVPETNGKSTLFAFSKVGNDVNSTSQQLFIDAMKVSAFPFFNPRNPSAFFSIPTDKGDTVINGVDKAKSGNPTAPDVALLDPRTNTYPYSPALSPGAETKITFPTGAEIVTSSSPAAKLATGGSYYIAPGLQGGDKNLSPLIGAGGVVKPGVTGQAAGVAYDPVQVMSSKYLYQTYVSTSIRLDGKKDFGGITYFAVDSRDVKMGTPDTFVEMGQPLDQTVWYLTISAKGPVNSLSDLNVQFKINDRSILNPVTSDGTMISDSSIADAIKNAITLDGNSATLSSFPLFPALTPDAAIQGETFYDVNDTISYAAGVDVGLTQFSVPEPSSLIQLGSGILGLLLACRFRVRAAQL